MFAQKIKYLLLIVLSTFGLYYFQTASASSLGGLDASAGKAGYSTKAEPGTSLDLPVIIGSYIDAALALLGIVFISLVMWGAFDIIGAGGNEELVKKSKGRIKNGAIGVLIILLSYFLAKAFVGFFTTGVFNIN